jgi:hypothetical protein
MYDDDSTLSSALTIESLKFDQRLSHWHGSCLIESDNILVSLNFFQVTNHPILVVRYISYILANGHRGAAITYSGLQFLHFYPLLLGKQEEENNSKLPSCHQSLSPKECLYQKWSLARA